MLEEENSRVLTERQVEIIGCVARGLDWREIGEELGISPLTVKKHILDTMRKMGARNKTHMVAMALAQNIIGPPPVTRTVTASIPVLKAVA